MDLWQSYGLASVQDLRSLYSSEQEVHLDLTSHGVPDQEARAGCLVWRDSLRAVACDKQAMASKGPPLVLPGLCGKEPLPSKEPLPRKVRTKAQSFRVSAERPAMNAIGSWRLQRAANPKRRKVQEPAQVGTDSSKTLGDCLNEQGHGVPNGVSRRICRRKGPYRGFSSSRY